MQTDVRFLIKAICNYTTIEMNDPSSRPEMESCRDNIADYDVVHVGFSIWWYVAPTLINTFLESHDLTGKTIVLFATSGGSGMGKTNEALLSSCKGVKLVEEKVFRANASKQEFADWANHFRNYKRRIQNSQIILCPPFSEI